MKRPFGTGRAARSWQLRSVIGVLLVACLLWGFLAFRPVRTDAQHYQWLAAHGVRESDPVAELGLQGVVGAASAVIVTTRSGIQAFVVLSGSRYLVKSTGVVIPVVLDLRESPAVGTGVAADLVGRSFAGDYARALAPPVTLAVLVLLAGGYLLPEAAWTATTGVIGEQPDHDR